MGTFSDTDLRLISLVSEDLAHLEIAGAPGASEAAIRRMSVQLRHLLVEDRLAMSWRCVGFPRQPKIVAKLMHPGSQMQGALSVVGGGQVGGVSVLSTFVSNETVNFHDPESRIKLIQNLSDAPRDLPLTEFLDSCAIWYSDTKISRRQVIKFAANKIGGAHLDNVRKKDDTVYKLLDELMKEGPFIGGVSDIGDHDLDTSPFKIPEGARGSVGFQMLSIAQCVTKSPDIRALRERCDDILRASEGQLNPL